MEDKKVEKGGKSEKKLVFAKTTYDVQRLKLEKMMQNPVSFRSTLNWNPFDWFDLNPD